MTDTPEQNRVEQLAEYLCSEFDFNLDPCVGYSWPEHPNDDGYRGDGNWVKLQPSDVQAYARENAGRILAFLATTEPMVPVATVYAGSQIAELMGFTEDVVLYRSALSGDEDGK